MPAKLKVKINKFLGIDNVNEPQKVKLGTLSIATNVDIQNDQSLAMRGGRTLKTAANFHSLWSNDSNTMAFAVRDGALVRVFPDGSTLPLGNYPVDAGVVYVDGKDGYVYCGSYGFLIRIDKNNNIYDQEELNDTEDNNYI